MEVCRLTSRKTEIWADLSTSVLVGDALEVRWLHPVEERRLLAAVDKQGHRHLLVTLVAHDEPLSDAGTRGLAVETHELVDKRNDKTLRCIDLICRDPSGFRAFDIIIDEIAEAMDGSQVSAPQVVASVLAKWRRFWGLPARNILSRAQQLGLFGEVWFLDRWLSPCVGIGESAQRWRGPLGSRHDFEWAAGSIEVKVSESSRAPLHRISSVEQLLAPESGPLLLFSLCVRVEDGGDHTLSSCVASAIKAAGQDGSALDQLEAKLSEAGYRPEHESEYDKLRLRISSEGLYTVVGDFPRIVPATFTAGVPAGVERMEYDINLQTFSHLRVAEFPHELQLP